MMIGGLEKLTLLDYPGEVACIIFTQGCNFRCQFCYNPMLVWPKEDSELKYQKDHSLFEEDDLFAFLKSRRGKLDGVVITGGEPTLHSDLPEFIAKIKSLGFKVKLDTNGTNPDMLERLINAPLTRGGRGVENGTAKEPPAPPLSGGQLVDYIAMDIKAPLDKYEKVAGVKVNLENIKKSVKMIMESGLPYEFRTTLAPGLHVKEDMDKMGEMIKGADKWYLQFLKTDTDLVNREFEGKDRFTEVKMKEMAEVARRYVKFCDVRG